jgi:hypothetical protein
MRKITPSWNSKTRRREARRSVREALGTSRDPATGPHAAMRALIYLAMLVTDATGGRFGVYVFDTQGGEYVQPSVAMARLREAGFEND